MRLRLSLTWMLLASPPLVLAQGKAPAIKPGTVVSWTDTEGELHYTDDPASIPADRRNSVHPVEGEIGEVTTRSSEAPAPRSSRAAAESAPAGEAGAPSEEDWRGRFAAARARIETEEGAVKEAQAAVDDPSAHGVPALTYTRGVYGPNPEVLKLQKALDEAKDRLRKAKAELTELDREASREAVPREWRR